MVLLETPETCAQDVVVGDHVAPVFAPSISVLQLSLHHPVFDEAPGKSDRFGGIHNSKGEKSLWKHLRLYGSQRLLFVGGSRVFTQFIGAWVPI